MNLPRARITSCLWDVKISLNLSISVRLWKLSVFSPKRENKICLSLKWKSQLIRKCNSSSTASDSLIFLVRKKFDIIFMGKFGFNNGISSKDGMSIHVTDFPEPLSDIIMLTLIFRLRLKKSYVVHRWRRFLFVPDFSQTNWFWFNQFFNMGKPISMSLYVWSV